MSDPKSPLPNVGDDFFIIEITGRESRPLRGRVIRVTPGGAVRVSVGNAMFGFKGGREVGGDRYTHRAPLSRAEYEEAVRARRPTLLARKLNRAIEALYDARLAENRAPTPEELVEVSRKVDVLVYLIRCGPEISPQRGT